MTDNKTGCVYALIDPESGNPRYIGATIDPDNRLKSHRSSPHSEDLQEWVSDLQGRGRQPQMEILTECPVEELSQAEKEAIEEHSGAHNLLNGSPNRGYNRHHVNHTPATTMQNNADETTADDLEEELQEVRERKEELLDIGWEKEMKLSEIRDAVEDARNAFENIDSEELQDALDRMEEILDGE